MSTFERLTTGQAGTHLTAALAMITIAAAVFFGLSYPADAATTIGITVPTTPEETVLAGVFSMLIFVGLMIIYWPLHVLSKRGFWLGDR